MATDTRVVTTQDGRRVELEKTNVQRVRLYKVITYTDGEGRVLVDTEPIFPRLLPTDPHSLSEQFPEFDKKISRVRKNEIEKVRAKRDNIDRPQRSGVNG